jgi:hypothetical protein
VASYGKAHMRVYNTDENRPLGVNDMTTDRTHVCINVAEGSVGETGDSALLTHSVSANTTKKMVLRNTHDSLCPNTGAIAVLAVNGIPVTAVAKGSSEVVLSHEVNPGDMISLIVHTVPMPNDAQCIRLGTFEFALDECDY